MKIAIVGSRSFTDYALLVAEVERLEASLSTKITGIVSGGAKGIDTLAEAYAREHSIPMQIIRPDYATYGRRAPLVRNKEIVKAADVVLAIWDGQSPGTAHALKMARELGIKTIVVIPQAE